MEKVQIVRGHQSAYSLVIAMPRQALWQRGPQLQTARKSFIRDRCYAFRHYGVEWAHLLYGLR